MNQPTYPVLKPTDDEIAQTKEWLDRLTAATKEAAQHGESKASNKLIADIAKAMPGRAFLIPIACKVIADNFLDKEEKHIQVPGWIRAMVELLLDLEKDTEPNQNLIVLSYPEFNERAKAILAEVMKVKIITA